MKQSIKPLDSCGTKTALQKRIGALTVSARRDKVATNRVLPSEGQRKRSAQAKAANRGHTTTIGLGAESFATPEAKTPAAKRGRSGHQSLI